MISSGIQTEEVNTETFTCPICFENIKPFNCVKLPNCNHRYCTECFLQSCNSSVESRYNCSYCRDQFITDDLKSELLKTKQELLWELHNMKNTFEFRQKELEELEERLDQYADELFFYQQEIPYLHLLNSNFEEFVKQKKRRDKKKILKGNKIWRKNMKNVFNEFFSPSGWIEDEEGLKNQLDPYIDDIELSGFSKKIFEEDESGYKIVYTNYNENSNYNTKFSEIKNDSEEDDCNYDSMPSLEDITSDEEEDDTEEGRRDIIFGRRIIENTRSSWELSQDRYFNLLNPQ